MATLAVQAWMLEVAITGTYPTTPQQIMGWLEETAQGWNQAPTKFEWYGKRKARRDRARQRRQTYRLAKSGGCTQEIVPLHLERENQRLSA